MNKGLIRLAICRETVSPRIKQVSNLTKLSKLQCTLDCPNHRQRIKTNRPSFRNDRFWFQVISQYLHYLNMYPPLYHPTIQPTNSAPGRSRSKRPRPSQRVSCLRAASLPGGARAACTSPGMCKSRWKHANEKGLKGILGIHKITNHACDLYIFTYYMLHGSPFDGITLGWMPDVIFLLNIFLNSLEEL